MKNFKQLFAVIFIIATIVFGVLVFVNEWDIISNVKNIDFKSWDTAKISLIFLLFVLVDVLLLALPAVCLLLLLTGKYDPFKAMVNCALIVLGKFLITIVVTLLFLAAMEMPIGYWNELFLGKDSLLIIPTLVFGFAFLALMSAKASNTEGTVARAVLATIGSGLAIFGLVFYFIKGGVSNVVAGSTIDSNAVTIIGLVVGITCFAGIVVYSFLPQTRETK